MLGRFLLLAFFTFASAASLHSKISERLQLRSDAKGLERGLEALGLEKGAADSPPSGETGGPDYSVDTGGDEKDTGCAQDTVCNDLMEATGIAIQEVDPSSKRSSPSDFYEETHLRRLMTNAKVWVRKLEKYCPGPWTEMHTKETCQNSITTSRAKIDTILEKKRTELCKDFCGYDVKYRKVSDYVDSMNDLDSAMIWALTGSETLKEAEAAMKQMLEPAVTELSSNAEKLWGAFNACGARNIPDVTNAIKGKFEFANGGVKKSADESIRCFAEVLKSFDVGYKKYKTMDAVKARLTYSP